MDLNKTLIINSSSSEGTLENQSINTIDIDSQEHKLENASGCNKSIIRSKGRGRSLQQNIRNDKLLQNSSLVRDRNSTEETSDKSVFFKDSELDSNISNREYSDSFARRSKENMQTSHVFPVGNDGGLTYKKPAGGSMESGIFFKDSGLDSNISNREFSDSLARRSRENVQTSHDFLAGNDGRLKYKNSTRESLEESLLFRDSGCDGRRSGDERQSFHDFTGESGGGDKN